MAILLYTMLPINQNKNYIELKFLLTVSDVAIRPFWSICHLLYSNRHTSNCDYYKQQIKSLHGIWIWSCYFPTLRATTSSYILSVFLLNFSTSLSLPLKKMNDFHAKSGLSLTITREIKRKALNGWPIIAKLCCFHKISKLPHLLRLPRQN